MLTQRQEGGLHMSVTLERQPMVEALRHLLADIDRNNDFAQPSLLEDVPAITAPDTALRGGLTAYAELSGRSQRDC